MKHFEHKKDTSKTTHVRFIGTAFLPAIKALREVFDMSLEEAKECVESYSGFLITIDDFRKVNNAFRRLRLAKYEDERSWEHFPRPVARLGNAVLCAN